MNTRRSIIAISAASLLLSSAHAQETIKPLDAEWATLAIITGFHEAFDKQNDFEVRLLEADGSVTVALNPVALYVVINNSSGADLQHYVWRLPHRVSEVKGVKLSPPILRIRAEIDADPSDSSKKVEKVLSVQYSVSHRVLSDTLSMSEEPLQ
jgi:hypothetical protein